MGLSVGLLCRRDSLEAARFIKHLQWDFTGPFTYPEQTTNTPFVLKNKGSFCTFVWCQSQLEIKASAQWISKLSPPSKAAPLAVR